MGKVDCKCGIFVAHSLHDAYNGLAGLQHRGQDACGIACLKENGDIDVLRWQGKVKDFSLNTAGKIFEGGVLFMGEVRYSTNSGKSDNSLFRGALPRFLGGRTVEYCFPNFPHTITRSADYAIIHNGNLVGVNPSGNDTDTDIMIKYYAIDPITGVERIINNIPAAYSAAIMDRTKKEVTIFKDQFGIRPLWIGEKDERLIASSEDFAIIQMGGIPHREVRPSEFISISRNGTAYSGVKLLKRQRMPCFFERMYLGSPLSTYEGISNIDTRRRAGIALAIEHSPEVDIVSFIPEAPEHYARAYADFRGLFFAPIFYKAKVVRAFLGPSQEQRAESINTNLYVRDDIDLEGKRILLLEDSIVRFNNARTAARKLRERKISWLALAVGTPRIGEIKGKVKHCCDEGVDMREDEDFAARVFPDLSIMAKEGEFDEIYHLSKSGLEGCLRRPLSKCCAYCIGEPHPVSNEDRLKLECVVKSVYERFPVSI